MLRYSKGKAPACLSALQSTPGATWESVHGDQRQQIREHLAHDQGELCAYCARRVRPTATEMRIDHYEARSAGGEPFNWNNLVGTCSGTGSDADATYETCDRSKQAKVLQLLDPREPAAGDPRRFLRYHANGHIHADDERAKHDITEVLNLNAPHLTRMRASILDGLRVWMKARKPTKAQLRRRVHDYADFSGAIAPEFAPVYEYHFERWLRAMGD